MDKITLDISSIDELENEFLELLSPDDNVTYKQLSTQSSKLQFIIDLVKNEYTPYFDNDEEMDDLIDEIDIMVDATDPLFELSSDIVDNFISLSIHVNRDDIHPEIKERMLIILTYALDVLGKNSD